MTNRPNDYINRAQLAISVAKSWGDNFPIYKVNFTTKSTFSILAQNFYQSANLNANNNALKKVNTEKLKQINDEIRTSSSRLKEYIRDSYTTNIDAMYAAYGFEKIGTTYVMPRDNDRLMQRLGMLLAKLQEPNNPIAGRNKGFLYWQELIFKHEMEWTKSKELKSSKAQISQDCKELHKEVGAILSKIFRQIALDNPADKVASVRRAFGFLNETYK